MTSKPVPTFRIGTRADDAAMIAFKWSMNKDEYASLSANSRFATRLDLSREAAVAGVEDYHAWIDEAGGELLLFEINGQIVASGAWVWDHAAPSTRPEERAQVMLAGIVVDPAFRGQGLGRFVMETLQRRAVEVGARWATLEVIASNAPARILYETQGFETVELVMIKDLREG